MSGLEADERQFMVDNIYQSGAPAAVFAHGGTQRLLTENARVATRMSSLVVRQFLIVWILMLEKSLLMETSLYFEEDAPCWLVLCCMR